MMEDTKKQYALFWIYSTVLSLIFVSIIGWTWYQVDSRYQPNNSQLINVEQAKAKLSSLMKENTSLNSSVLAFIPTGIYVQSLQFSDANDIKITGYIWQHFNDNKTVETINQPQFIFPETVSGNIEQQAAYQQKTKDGWVVGWFFNVTLRQNFNYIDYPLDHKTVWIRLRSTDFDNNKLLLPALNDYKSTDLEDKFALDEDIVIGDWQVNETFFDYKIANYTSNFGLSSSATQPMSHPELNFNIVLKRKFLNAFIIHLVPLITVAVLLFSLLLTVTSDTNKKESFGFNYMGVISIVAALFFVVVLSHIQLRQQFAENSIVYIEYFFLLMYFLMMSLIFNTYRFTRNVEQKKSWLTVEDHLWPKLLFWPITLGVMAAITLIKFC